MTTTSHEDAPARTKSLLEEAPNNPVTVANVKKPDSWGPAVAALTLGVLAIAIFVLFFYGIRGIF